MRNGIVALGALVLAACAQPVAGPTYDLSLYPACADVSTAEAAPEGCVLHDDTMMHSLLASRANEKTQVRVIADGEGGQVMEETSDAPMFAPTLADLDGDGQSDVLIPLTTGNVNTTWAVYLAGPDASYTRIGEISGVNWAPSATGLLAVHARSSASTVEVAFYDVEPGALTPVATVTVEAQQGDPNDAIETICVLTDSPGIAALGLSAEQAQVQFCGDPTVAGLFE